MTKLSLFALLLAGACTRVESDNVLTSGMYADITASADGSGITTVNATLFLGNPGNLDYVDLTGGDELQVAHGDQVKVMNETIILNAVGHSATFQTDNEDDEFVVDFVRDVDSGAPNSVVTLPAPLAMEPVAGSVSRAQPLTINWEGASPDEISVSANGSCIVGFGTPTTEDAGSATLDAGSLVKQQGAQISDSCDVTLTVTRSRQGELDTHFGEGGRIVGEQTQSITFTSVP
jgi:hypothetical protein